MDLLIASKWIKLLGSLLALLSSSLSKPKQEAAEVKSIKNEKINKLKKSAKAPPGWGRSGGLPISLVNKMEFQLIRLG